tara:strand:- start:7624 stop:10071 length:2448 start_codon:yes stop_codon:yes gene_type:complete
MGIVSRAIPTLLRGVSQASDSSKQADHADIQDNADSNPVVGLIKRSGIQHVTNLSTATLGNVHIQTINRDATEQYVAIFSNGNVKVYELDGTEKTVEKPDGTTYLNTTNPREEIKTVTIADFTFVVNTSSITAMDTALSGGTGTKAIIFIQQVSNNTAYTVTVDGVTVTDDTTNDSTLSTSGVANDIANGLSSGLTGFNVTRNGSVIYIRKTDGSNFSIDGSDTQGNTQLSIVKDSVQRFTDLPTVSPNGYIVEVKGDDQTNFDNYYVKFATNNGGTFEEGQWEETVQAGIPFKFDSSTMPHVLIRQADGNFRFARVDGDSYTISGTTYTLPVWTERTSGDEISAPDPSFIGRKINNVFFFRNRLGFLADDNVILSNVSDFFNFFPDTVLTIVDSHPIDVAASHTKVAILKHAVTMGEQLILFSEQTQFILSSSADNLTPLTANVLVATEFESSDDAPPVGSGSSIYFLTKKGAFAGIREYITQTDVTLKDASNITIHVPRLIPSNIFKLAVSNNQDILVCLGTDTPNKLYINRWLYGTQGQKVLNSWFTFTINENRSIKNVDFIGTDLFMVIEEASNVTLEKLPFESDYKEANATFEYHLDHKVTEAEVTVAYNTLTKKTTFTLPYRLRAAMNVVGRYTASNETSTFIDLNGTTQSLKAGTIVKTTNLTDGTTTTIEANGDYTNAKVIIGEPFEMHYRFSKQRITESPTQSSAEIISSRLQLHHFYIKYEMTGFFKVEVTPEYRDTSTHKFSGRLLGAASSAIGQINLASGTFRVPIMTRADRVDIDVKNITFLPTLLASAEFEAMFNMRSRRM